MKNYYILILLLFYCCSNKDNIPSADIPSLNGHWYLSDLLNQSNLAYLEFIIKDNRITRINDGGFAWNNENIIINSDSLLQLGVYEYKVKSYTEKSLILGLVEDFKKELHFNKLDSCVNEEFYKEIVFRKLLYEIKTTSITDTVRITFLQEYRWDILGGAVERLEMEEEALERVQLPIVPVQER